MRAREFLFEYNRQITANQVGNRLLTALAKDQSAEGRGFVSLRTKLRTLANATPEQINAVITPEKQQEYISSILSAIEEKDPTPNKAYTPWLARMYAKGGLKIEDMNRHNILGIYDLGKRRRMIKPADADINRFKTYRDFETTMRDNYDLDEIDNTEKKEDDKGSAKTVYDGPEVRVVVPENEAAACYYGRGTRWCTAATKGENYFDHYNKSGPMYILIPKNPAYAGEKYQLHFPSHQFMDPKDEEVSLFYLLDKRFPELKEFFMKQEPEIQDYIIFASDEVLQPLIDKIAEMAEERVWEVLSDWEFNDEYYYQQMRELYPDPEGDIDWDKVHEAGDDYTTWNDEARRFSIDMRHALQSPAKRLKKWAEESATDMGYTAKIEELPEVIANMVRDEFPSKRENDGGIPDFLDRRIVVRKDGDGWQAGWAKKG